MKGVVLGEQRVFSRCGTDRLVLFSFSLFQIGDL